MVPWDRDRLPTLHGTIPRASRARRLDASHIAELLAAARAAGEGGHRCLLARRRRLVQPPRAHQAPPALLPGPSVRRRPNVRPWSLQRNGYPGIAQWGGWVWSGDTDSSWKTLEAQIAVGINYSLSIGPYWGSDIGGFYPNSELTGELYARWFQFAAFCGSFRSHGRTWWTRLPWGWGLSDMGPREHNNTNAPIPPDDRRNILPSEMNNPAIEPVAKKYAELRYQLLPYTYTLAWEARDSGLPLMRAMWLHYPDDVRARGLGPSSCGAAICWSRRSSRKARPRVTSTCRRATGTTGGRTTKSTGGADRDACRSISATMPMYVRAGAIVPFDPVRQYTSQPVTEPTTLKVYTRRRRRVHAV